MKTFLIRIAIKVKDTFRHLLSKNSLGTFFIKKLKLKRKSLMRYRLIEAFIIQTNYLRTFTLHLSFSFVSYFENCDATIEIKLQLKAEKIFFQYFILGTKILLGTVSTETVPFKTEQIPTATTATATTAKIPATTAT